jgi:ribonuclease D
MISPDDSSEVQPVGSEPDAPLLELRAGLPRLVETPTQLDQVVANFSAGTGPVAIDAERASGYRYSQRAYLVQLRRSGAGSALIDPVPFGDVPNESLRPLAEAVADAEWVLHAASQDLPCLAELGMRPRRLFDTELAGRLLNYPRVALGVLVEELLGYRMRKEHSAVDWSKRPLPAPWLHYAALDVEVLLELRDVLAEQLVSAGKAQWAQQEFAAWAALPAARPRVDPWRRTSGIHRVRGRRGLAVVKALWEKRDALAQQRDTTASRILPDTAIVEAAATTPRSRNALAQVAGFSGRGAQRYLRHFYAALAEAGSTPDAELPPLAAQVDGPPAVRSWQHKYPEAAARLASCRGALQPLAVAHDLPQENLLAADAVRRLAWRPPDPVTTESVAEALTSAGARPWQVELTAAALADALGR